MHRHRAHLNGNVVREVSRHKVVVLALYVGQYGCEKLLPAKRVVADLRHCRFEAWIQLQQ